MADSLSDILWSMQDSGYGVTTAEVRMAHILADGSVPTKFYPSFNATVSTLTPNNEIIKRKGKTQRHDGKTLDSASKTDASDFKIETDTIENRPMLERILLGKSETIAPQTSTFNPIAVELSGFYETKLGYDNPSNLTIVGLGSLTNQGVVYKQLQDGTLASLTITLGSSNDLPLTVSLQNTTEVIVELGTDGAGAADDTKNTVQHLLDAITASATVSALISATLADDGDTSTVLTAVSKTNFTAQEYAESDIELIDSAGVAGASGYIRLSADSNIAEGEMVKISGSYKQLAGYEVLPGTDTKKEFYCEMDVYNRLSGNRWVVTFPRLEMSPDGDFNLLSEEVSSISFTCSPNVPSNGGRSEKIRVINEGSRYV